ncbi:MAG: efflux RND transporter periplasmic adaptor subunit [Magnetococcales bacterium]|nr:efflux RND transporter periplasmic adaptor subunit [Magnetococcales bacterium]
MDPRDHQITALSTFIHLEERARNTTNGAELAFLMVNETPRLIPCPMVAFWLLDGTGRPRVEAVSGVDRPERDAPFSRWLRGVVKSTLKDKNPGAVSDIPPEMAGVSAKDRKISHTGNPSPQVSQTQGEGGIWRGLYGLWCPFVDGDGRVVAGLWLGRENQWQEQEKLLLAKLTAAFAHAWHTLHPRGTFSKLFGGLKRQPWRLIPPLLLAAALTLPVPQTVLAPAQVTPLTPFPVTAPLAGVVKHFAVKPNQSVHLGDLLFELDDTSPLSQLDLARGALEVARAEYDNTRQKVLMGDDPGRKVDLLVQKTKVELKAMEVAHYSKVLKRSQVRAERDGIAIFGDVNDWLGRPVKVGEKVLTVADPSQVALTIWLPVADAISLTPEARVALFLNIEPTRPLPARLKRSGYEPALAPDGFLAFNLLAHFSPNLPPPRIGLRGTAKIYGEEVPLYYYLIRRPLAAMRQWLGF